MTDTADEAPADAQSMKCPNCGDMLPMDDPGVIEIPVTVELLPAERAAIYDRSLQGELGRFLAERAPQLLDDDPVKVVMRELDRRLPRVTNASPKVAEAAEKMLGRARRRRRTPNGSPSYG